MIEEDMVGCETAATDWPVAPDGHPYHGVKVTADGHIEWVQGDLGDTSLVKLEYQNYHAMDWTIIASSSGTCFTNDRTGHGMFVSVETCPRSDQDYSRQADVLHLSATSN
jgi:hypothetical protein